jgi:hypothetical protein
MEDEFEKDEKYRRISGTGKSSLSEPAGSLQRLLQGQNWAFKRL